MAVVLTKFGPVNADAVPITAEGLLVMLVAAAVALLYGLVLHGFYLWSKKKNNNDQTHRNHGPRPGR